MALPLSISFIKSEIKANYSAEFKRAWKVKAESHLWAKAMIAEPSLKVSNHLISLPRERLRVLVGIKTGMAPLKYIMTKWGIISDPSCRKCNGPKEDVRHWITTCAGLRFIRIEVFGLPVLDENVELGSLSLFKLLKFAERSGLAKIFREKYNEED